MNKPMAVGVIKKMTIDFNRYSDYPEKYLTEFLQIKIMRSCKVIKVNGE